MMASRGHLRTGKGTHGRPQPHWRDYISHLAWEWCHSLMLVKQNRVKRRMLVIVCFVLKVLSPSLCWTDTQLYLMMLLGKVWFNIYCSFTGKQHEFVSKLSWQTVAEIIRSPAKMIWHRFLLTILCMLLNVYLLKKHHYFGVTGSFKW